jgi:hypothetical protein
MWEIVIGQIHKEWPEMKFDKYIVCNSDHDLKFHDTKVVNVGMDRGWSTNLKMALSVLNYDYIFLWIDDLFLYEKVDHAFIDKALQTFVELDGNYLRLSPVPPKDIYFNQYFGIIKNDTIYRASTVMSIWKKSILLDLLHVGESAWEFEYNGSLRSKIHDKFFVLNKSSLRFKNAVVKGSWDSLAYQWVRNMNIYDVNTVRPILSPIQLMKIRVRSITAKYYYFFRRLFLKNL